MTYTADIWTVYCIKVKVEEGKWFSMIDLLRNSNIQKNTFFGHCENILRRPVVRSVYDVYYLRLFSSFYFLLLLFLILFIITNSFFLLCFPLIHLIFIILPLLLPLIFIILPLFLLGCLLFI